MSDELYTYLNNTRNLLEDSFSHTPYTSSANSNIRRMNNTAYLLGEKTSMNDGKLSKISYSKHLAESQASISSVMKNIPKQDFDNENG
jgi:hypothetical protein